MLRFWAKTHLGFVHVKYSCGFTYKNLIKIAFSHFIPFSNKFAIFYHPLKLHLFLQQFFFAWGDISPSTNNGAAFSY